MKHYIKSVASYSMVGGFGLLFIASLSGCDKKQEEQSPFGKPAAEAPKEAQGQFMVIQEISPGKYKVIEQYPTHTAQSRAVLRDINGTEKLLSDAELREMANVEAAKVDAGTSNLTKNPDAQVHSGGGGMGLGETILAGAAGALIGGYIANKLFSNPNFQANQKAAAPSAMSRPASPAGAAGAKAPAPQSGFFKPAAPAAAPAAAPKPAPAPAPKSGYFKSEGSPSGSHAPSGAGAGSGTSSGG